MNDEWNLMNFYDLDEISWKQLCIKFAWVNVFHHENMEGHTEPIHFGLFSNLSISRTPRLTNPFWI